MTLLYVFITHHVTRAFDFMIVKKAERFSLPATSAESVGVDFQKQTQMGFFVLAIPTHSTMKEIAAENHAGARVNHSRATQCVKPHWFWSWVWHCTSRQGRNLHRRNDELSMCFPASEKHSCAWSNPTWAFQRACLRKEFFLWNALHQWSQWRRLWEILEEEQQVVYSVPPKKEKCSVPSVWDVVQQHRNEPD